MEAVDAIYSDLGLFLLAGRATTIGQEKTKEGAWLADVILQNGSLNGSFKHQRGKSPLVLGPVLHRPSL